MGKAGLYGQGEKGLFHQVVKSFRKQQQRPKKSSLIAGRAAIINALKTGEALDRIYIDTRAKGEEISEIRNLALKNSIPVNYVPQAKLDSFNITDHDGVIALKAKIRYQE